MSPMNGDAPPSPTLADQLTKRFATLDHSTNAVHDALNRAVPWLWWPLTVPGTDRRLAAREHALYAVHAGLGIGLACALSPARSRSIAVAGGVAALASWAIFTGAWDRRADQAASCERRAT